MYSEYHEQCFRRSVEEALEQVKAILGTAKNPCLAEDEDHTYPDKYALAEYITNSSIAALLHVLDRLGLDAVKLKTLLKWVVDDQKAVILSFRAEDGCSFIQETQQDIAENLPSLQVETIKQQTGGTSDSGGGETTTQTTSNVRVVHKVKRYHWNVTVRYAIAVYPGTDTASALELQSRTTSTEIITLAGMAHNHHNQHNPSPPISEYTVHKPVEVNITWLLQSLNRDAGECRFAIDRTLASCKTPRRNEAVEAAVEFQNLFAAWSNRVGDFLTQRFQGDILSKHQNETAHNENSLYTSANGVGVIFKPIVPLMENGSVLTPADTGALMNAHSKSIHQICQGIAQMFPPSDMAKLATTAEATILVLCAHAVRLAEQYRNSIDYVETMLTKQLVQAIGKQVRARDFDRFMRFHNQKLFQPMYAPKPFSYAIRQPNRYPDGILSIESEESAVEDGCNNIETIVRHIPGDSSNPPIRIPINAATSVEITGDRFLHGWIQHRFESSEQRQNKPQYKLVARARQFSCFLLMVGTMAGKDIFSPKHAIILQNKDEVLIPLLTEVLPTAKEFKDAIASLSPEQQDFAKAYRGMQLESSVFGVVVIQLKPQLEKLLGLPAGALAKEMQLTQDLMSLFVDFQIPSDLLSFDGDATAETSAKLVAVKGHVKNVMDVIVAAKEKQITEQERKAEFAKAYQETEYQDQMLVFETSHSLPSEFNQAYRAYRNNNHLQQQMMGFQEQQMMVFPESHTLESRSLLVGSPAPPMAAVSCAAYVSDLGSAITVNESLPVPQQASVAQNEAMTRNEDLVDDLTLVPKVLDAKVEKYDADSSLKSTIIKAGTEWQRLRQENLLTKMIKSKLDSDAIQVERNKAFDLLDAISRSGALSIDCAELHVVVALSHCFEKNVMDTIIQDNVNPIEKAERSSLIVASTIHDEPCQILLVGNNNCKRLGTRFPTLFAEEE